jgi:3,4-dihydroxy 2-butanone 4-phosphate synthase/GTP cyclohydrolase II
MAGLSGVAVIGEVVDDDDGSMRRGDSLRRFAATHDLPLLSIADLIRHRRSTEPEVELIGTSYMPTEFGDFRAMVYRNVLDGTEHLAMVMGDIVGAGQSTEGALVRVHSECLTGDIVGSLRCDCGAQLEQAFHAIAREGVGAVVYLRGHEGRGIGLGHKIRAYALQEEGLDTVDANTVQGLPVDSRSYAVGAKILNDLDIHRLRLITNNPAKYSGIDGHGLEITRRVSLPTAETPHNMRYLRTKRERMHHDIPPAC